MHRFVHGKRLRPVDYPSPNTYGGVVPFTLGSSLMHADPVRSAENSLHSARTRKNSAF